MIPDPIPLELTPDQKFILLLAREAGNLLYQAWHNPSRRLDTPHGPQIPIELKVSQHLKKTLDNYDPAVGYLGEEYIKELLLDPTSYDSLPSQLDPRQLRNYLVADPLDSTRDYQIKDKDPGSLHWSLQLAWVENSVTTTACSYRPQDNDLILSILENGTYQRISRDQWQKTRVSPADDITILCSKRRSAGITDLLPSILSDATLVPMSGAWRFCEVAKGTHSAAITPPGNAMHLWDLHAAQLQIKEAGGTITDGYGRPLNFHGPLTFSNGIVASNCPNASQTFHQDLLELCQEYHRYNRLGKFNT